MSSEAQNEQSALWNGVAGRGWVEAQVFLDQLFMPFEQMLVAAAAERPRDGVLDVGCGTGATTLAVARQPGISGRCTGVDISEPMIDAARASAGRESLPATFICADAQHHAFAPASVDLVISRFGVMFFEDPVAAFGNLRRATRDGGELKLVVWRGPEENPFMTLAERTAAPLLPGLPRREPGAPGQFGFADPQRVRGILESSGWHAIDIAPVDVSCSFPESELTMYLTRLGPLGRALPEVVEPLRSQVVDAVRAEFESSYVQDGEVWFGASCWMVSARAG
ncbi:MAG: class I SAM-dependent methyltransferase [Pseudomonadota bacterium]|nr:class I SAM-dependent methyltransferase [Pseudomonadota bacterium]